MNSPDEKRLRRVEKKLLQAQKALQDRLENVGNSKPGPDVSWTDFNPPSLLPLIKAAINRNPNRAAEGEEAARVLLSQFIETVANQCRNSGTPHAITFDEQTGKAITPKHLSIDADLCIYLADRFRLIIRKKNPVPAPAALNLSKSNKRGPKASSETPKNHLRWGYDVATEYRRLKGLPPRQIFRIADLPVYQARTVDVMPDRKMQRAVNNAVESGLLQANPANRAGRYMKEKKMAGSNRMKINPLTRQEPQALLVAAEKCGQGALILTALRTGLRMGELFGLQ